MEQIDIILSIIASCVSIVATIIALQSRSEVRELRDVYEGNRLCANGGGNTQVVGSNNVVGKHGE